MSLPEVYLGPFSGGIIFNCGEFGIISISNPSTKMLFPTNILITKNNYKKTPTITGRGLSSIV